MGLGLVQHGAEKPSGHLTAQPGACGEGIKGIGDRLFPALPGGRVRDRGIS